MTPPLLKIPLHGQLYTVRADLFLALLLSGQWPEAKGQQERKGKLASVRIYDNCGKTFDRFTAVFMDSPERHPNTFAALGMSKRPFHPQGYGQHCTAQPGPHLGKRIQFEQLPKDCQQCVMQDLS